MPSRKVTTTGFDSEVASATTPVLVDFWASWCGPCRALGPTVEKVADELDGRLTVLKCNVDEEPELATRFGIVSIPTLIVFVGGKAVHTMVGNMPAAELRHELDRFV